MKIRCISNQSKDANPDSRCYSSNPDSKESLVIGEEYTVYAVATHLNMIDYYICDDDKRIYPLDYSSNFFEVSDSKLSHHWEFSILTYMDKNRSKGLILAHHEWAKDPLDYFWKLVDGDSEVVDNWENYKSLIDKEAEQQR